MTDQKNFYVNNKELLEHLIKRKAINNEREAKGLEKLKVDDYLGYVIKEIARRLAFRPNFINYTFREDLIGDAIESGLKGIDKYDVSYNNPFAYITQIMWHAFVRRIQTEQKQQSIKAAMISEMPLDELFATQDHDDDGVQYSHHIMNYLRENNFSHDRLSETDAKLVVEVIEPVGLERFF